MRVHIFLLLFFLPVFVFAQFHITGKVVEQNGTPLEYAEVAVKTLDSANVKSATTNSEGAFDMAGMHKGRYLLVVTYVAQTLHTQTLTVEKDVALKTISVNTATALKEVVLESKKPLIEKKVDRLIFNVSQSVAATGGNALDALKLAPRIQIQNDIISIVGKGSVAVMINDRIVKMSGEELANYLKSLSADDIKSIEIITNPPAKYSANGSGGLINIVLKKAQKDAWNALPRASYIQATYPTASVGGSFNMQRGKFQLNSSANYTNGFKAPYFIGTTYYPSQTWREATDGRKDFTDAFSARLDLDYQLHKKLSTGISYSIGINNPLMHVPANTKIFQPTTLVVDSSLRIPDRLVNETKSHALNYHLIYDIDTLGKKLSFDVDVFNYRNTTRQGTQTFVYYPRNVRDERLLQSVSNQGVQDIQNYSLSIDMEHPTKWAELNYGGRIAFTETNNVFDYFNIQQGQPILDPKSSNEFNYKENIQALYWSATKQFSPKWGAKIGLRYEWTQTTGFSKTVNSTTHRSYSTFFPSAYLTYSPNENHYFTLNYGKRIGRPGYGMLNPFRYVSNSYSYSEGNPFLQPSFTHNVELGYTFKEMLGTTLYADYTENKFQQLTITDSVTKIQVSRPQNVLENTSFGLSQWVMLKPTKWWNLTASADVYYVNTTSKIPQTFSGVHGWNASFRVNSDVTLAPKKNLIFFIGFGYFPEQVFDIYRMATIYQLDASLKWMLLNKRLTISLYVSDMLRSGIQTITGYSNGIKNVSESYMDQRYARLGISYSLGKPFKTQNRESKNQEEKDRAK